MVEWLKQNKKLIIILVLGYVGIQVFQMLFGVNVLSLRLPSQSVGRNYGGSTDMMYGAAPASGTFGSISAPGLSFAPSYPSTQYAEKVSTSEDRMVITTSNLSLHVSDVKDSGAKIVDYVEKQGGFMVQTSYNRPNESPFGTLVLRIPSSKLNSTLDFMRSSSIKVTSENLMGTDVTDQYEDVEEKLSILIKTKAKFEAILSSAVSVQDILTVQREVLNVQSQIDSLKGRKDALEKNASYSKVTVYLSTDELALPYTPDTTFRPAVVFKLAVRSLIGTLRSIGEWAIWIGVYSVVWLPILILVILYRKYRARKTSQ